MTTRMLNAALDIARRGIAVFPCRPRDKRPATANGLKDATCDATTITAWWFDNPEYNLAIATGEISNVFVIDVDGVDGEAGEAELRKLEAQHGALPPTVEVITGKGRHAYFAWPPDRPIRNSTSKIAPGVDVRGSGGYVLAPPSLHPSGRRYCWSADSAHQFAPAPPWLLDLAAAPSQGSDLLAAPAAQWADLIRDGVGEGQRNDTIARIVGHLLRRRVNALVALQLAAAFNAARCRPPLADAEVLSIVNSIAGCELKRRGHE